MSSTILETRTRILKATLDLLSDGRAHAVRMTDIAKQAGISRQAVYLHFDNRADLLIAATLYLDELKGSDDRLVPSRTAKSGVERLDAFVEGWANYIPEIFGIGKALMAMKEDDEAAAAAWNQRMQDMREGCEAAILALQHDKQLRPGFSADDATDILWTLLSIRNWEQLRIDCGWSQEQYIQATLKTARRLFIRD
ncbi:TetR/AcrR family transcriptional regulator [Sneathiella marina]|uniref:TetR/AcrR family transcriptional regulator n=1 Tax=Sneathiella marina TaxID=2950108 RepID=A0ABY4W083_9PROT|nr:TetR/AcrR family transcriptional regulator [Sneathiella marina]USG60591.1 TetR/AcrR family transcriptional regulator [Sneathiella marina]